MKYECVVYNDMGNLCVSSKNDKLPKNIEAFVYDKIKNKLNVAVDVAGLGCAFYILKSGLQNKWQYNINNNVVVIIYDVDKFNSNTMRYV